MIAETPVSIQLGYLHNVLSTETPPETVHPVAVAAQSIAARTFAYWQIDFNQTYGINPINNSASGFQVYVPFAYDALEPNDKQVVEDALANRFYLTYATGPRVEDVYSKQFVREIDDPIFAEFNSESVERTIDHPTNAASFPYMHAVADPISSHPTLDPTYQKHGFIQHGASRWAKGDVGWNLQLDREPWSVRWIYPDQILSHYYTGIHLRNADNNNELVTPAYRWVPLSVEWGGLGPEYVCAGDVVTATFRIQNTGTEAWDLNGSFRFDYTVEPIPGGPSGQTQEPTIDAIIDPGEFYTRTVTIPASAIGPVGTSKLVRFDMVRGTLGPFRNLESANNRPWYDFAEDLRVSDCYNAYLPLVQGGPNAAVSQ